MKYFLLLFIVLLGCSSKNPVVSNPDNTRRHQVNLSWILPPEYTNITVYRSVDQVHFSPIVTTTGKNYTDKNVQPNVTYYYKSNTFCKNCTPNTSTYSNIVHIKVP